MDIALRMALAWVCGILLLGSMGALIVLTWRNHRRRASANFHSLLWVEIVWTLVPLVMVLLSVWPTARVLFGR